ncbi:AtpZ/AtpI family protein [Alkaliphilus transvaalensis]|uniref:AtpZ/AtpI family protein n=1 Tax=Alkaliphilus transvaalensis TaxID=114628 RepID=UPI00047BC809|nr:AtpZ/AtpI family protein [Alkaliphilus transvaalensis]
MGKKNHPLANVALITYLGISMVTPILVGLFLGRWLDRRFNTEPLWLLVFIVLGIGGAFGNLFRVATKNIPKKRK